jgi:4-amino-4-deoxy-L-arabinose transferase-like glycosyltransferase
VLANKVMLKSTPILLIIIILFSFWLRVWGIQFGLPFPYHSDEQQYILTAIRFVSGDFQPQAHYNPALYPYLIGVTYTLTYLGLKLFNAFPAYFDLNTALSESMQPWLTGLFYLARYTSVAIGVLTTLVVYQLGRRAYSRETGLGAAVIFGLTFLPAREAHFAVSDAPVALGVAITLYLCLNIVKRGYGADYLWAGVALGLSAATKYSAGLLALPLGVAHLLSQRYHHWSHRLRYTWLVITAGLGAVVSYLLTSPYTLIEKEEFGADFSENLESARVGFLGLDLDPAGGAAFYLKSLIWGFGWPLFVLFLVAVLFALWRRRRVDLVLLTLPVFGFFYMQRQEMYFVRWLMPFLPPMAVLAAETLRAGIRRLSGKVNHYSPPVVRYLPLVITILLTLPSTYVALRADYVFSQLDTRTEALNWIRQNIPPGSTLAAEVLSPLFGPPLAMPSLDIGPYNFAPVPDGGVAEIDLPQYREWGVQYIIASSFYYARPLRDKAHQAQLAARMQALDENAELVALFQPYEPEYNGFFYHDQVYGPANDTLYRKQPGPIIKIYRLRFEE